MIINSIHELNDLIREMEKRLEMFIGDKNLGRLSCFLDGFLYSKDINSVALTRKEKVFQETFYKWIKNYYNSPEINVGWESIILFYAGSNHIQASKNFFELYKEWHKEEFGEDAW